MQTMRVIIIVSLRIFRDINMKKIKFEDSVVCRNYLFYRELNILNSKPNITSTCIRKGMIHCYVIFNYKTVGVYFNKINISMSILKNVLEQYIRREVCEK